MKYLLLYFFIFSFLFAKIPKYKDVQVKLKKLWDQTYPIPFLKISPYKQDKFLMYKTKKGKLYIYPFKIFIPIYLNEDFKIYNKKKGREVFVKVIYYPKDKKYKLSLDSFHEKFQTGKIRWIK